MSAKKAYEELDKAIEDAQLAGVVFATGGVLAGGGNPMSAAGFIGGGLKYSKDSFRHFKRSKDLFDELREREVDLERDVYENERRDFDSWDHDY